MENILSVQGIQSCLATQLLIQVDCQRLGLALLRFQKQQSSIKTANRLLAHQYVENHRNCRKYKSKTDCDNKCPPVPANRAGATMKAHVVSLHNKTKLFNNGSKTMSPA
eukprot:4466295-Amphidinium_carterae.1